jgi:hypothetical protein
MGFDSLSCTHCGSGDVQEIKPDTYFCNHCKNVFRYVDTSQTTVGDQPGFCGCGNPVEFRCQACKGVLCDECDTVGQAATWALGHHQRFIATAPADGFGYLLDPEFFDEGSSGQLSRIANDRIIPIKLWSSQRVPASGRIGPFLTLNDVLLHVAAAFPGGVRHLCRGCALAAVPATARAISDRSRCEHSGCGEGPDRQCRCCFGSFCKDHATAVQGNMGATDARRSWHQEESSPDRPTPVVKIDWTRRDALGDRHYDYRDKFTYFFAPRLHGFCIGCTFERRAAVEVAYSAICDAWPELEREGSESYQGDDPKVIVYTVTMQERKRRSQQRAEDDLARQVADQCSAAIGERAREIERLPGECTRVVRNELGRHIIMGQAVPGRTIDNYSFRMRALLG